MSVCYAEVVDTPLAPERVISKMILPQSGCVVNYVGLIRESNFGKPVTAVEYTDAGHAREHLLAIAQQALDEFDVNGVAVAHRIGRLGVGEINLVIAVSAAHREAGLEACRKLVGLFKEKLPTAKREYYTDGSSHQS